MDGGFREAQLSGYDAHAVTFPMQLSHFVTIDNDSRPAKCFAFLPCSAQSSRYALSDDILLEFGDGTQYLIPVAPIRDLVS